MTDSEVIPKVIHLTFHPYSSSEIDKRKKTEEPANDYQEAHIVERRQCERAS